MELSKEQKDNLVKILTRLREFPESQSVTDSNDDSYDNLHYLYEDIEAWHEEISDLLKNLI